MFRIRVVTSATRGYRKVKLCMSSPGATIAFRKPPGYLFLVYLVQLLSPQNGPVFYTATRWHQTHTARPWLTQHRNKEGLQAPTRLLHFRSWGSLKPVTCDLEVKGHPSVQSTEDLKPDAVLTEIRTDWGGCLAVPEKSTEL